MAVNSGSNTSANLQAAIKVIAGGCITEALKAALESQIVIEFPDALQNSASVDVLTSTAVSQVVTQLVSSPEFSTLIGNALADPEYVSQITSSTVASEDFTEAVTQVISDVLAEDETISTLSASLLSLETFKSQVIQTVVSSDEAEALVEAKVLAKIVDLDLFRCGEGTYTVEAGNVVSVPVSGATGTNYWFDYQITGYSNAGGGTNADASSIQSRTSSAVTIAFPNAVAGDSVTLEHIRINCNIS